MSDILVDAHEISRSYDVFNDPNTYRAFDLSSDHRRLVGCIDPRDEERQQLQVIVQTPGGAAGKGLDASLALTAHDNEGNTYTIQDGLSYDSQLQRATVAGAHEACRFIMGLGAVNTEIAEPQDITQDILRGLVARYELKDSGIQKQFSLISHAANRKRDEVGQSNPETLLQEVNELYPRHENVIAMRGANRATFYILNHHPYVGLDREKVHRGDEPLIAQAYHDNVRASMESLQGTVGMPTELKNLRLAALLLRTAATRSVLCADSRDMRYLHVVPTTRGLQIEEEYL